MRALAKAMEDAFDAHERYRELLRKAREQHKEARSADERVRQLRRLDRERVRNGRAA